MIATIVFFSFIFFSFVLAILCFRLRNKPPMIQIPERETEVSTPEIAKSMEGTWPPKRAMPKKVVTAKSGKNDEFVNGIMQINASDRVGNVFWSDWHRNDDDD